MGYTIYFIHVCCDININSHRIQKKVKLRYTIPTYLGLNTIIKSECDELRIVTETGVSNIVFNAVSITQLSAFNCNYPIFNQFEDDRPRDSRGIVNVD